MSEAFHILEEEEIIDLGLCEKMTDMTGFRNVIAHDYEKIDYDIVYDATHEGLNDIENFLKIIEETL